MSTDPVAPGSQPPSGPSATSAHRPSPQRLRRLLLALAGLGALLAATAALVWWRSPPPLPPPPPLPGIVQLLALGDTGADGAKPRAVAEAMAGYAGDHGGGFAATLLLGDNFYVDLPGGTDDPNWRRLFEDLYDPVRLPMPFYAVLGNADVGGRERTEVDYARTHPQSRWKMPARWYRLDLPPDRPLVTVLMLDVTADGEPADAHDRWLASELAGKRAAWTVVCAHYPLFSNGMHGDQPRWQKRWGLQLREHHIDFYLSGHDHDLQHLELPGWPLSFIISGGGGAGLRPLGRNDRGPFSRSLHGFAHLAFTADDCTVRLISPGLGTVHAFRRTKPGLVTVLETTASDRVTPP